MELQEKLKNFVDEESAIKSQIDDLQNRLKQTQSKKGQFIRNVSKLSVFDREALTSVLIDLFNVYKAPERFKRNDLHINDHGLIVDSRDGGYLSKPKAMDGIEHLPSEVVTLYCFVDFNGKERVETTFEYCPQFVCDFFVYVVSSRMEKPFSSNDVKRLKELEKSFLISRKADIERMFNDIEKKEIEEVSSRAAKRNLVLKELIE